MTIDANDPRITAYAFGELDSQEQRAFEEELAGSQDIQEQVEETRRMIATLQQELRAEPGLELTAEQRAKVSGAMRQAAPPVHVPPSGGWSVGAKLLAFVGVAACLLLLASPLMRARNPWVAIRDQAPDSAALPAPSAAMDDEQDEAGETHSSPTDSPFSPQADPAASAPFGDVTRARSFGAATRSDGEQQDMGGAMGAGAAPAAPGDKREAKLGLPEDDRYSRGLSRNEGPGLAAPAAADFASNQPEPSGNAYPAPAAPAPTAGGGAVYQQAQAALGDVRKGAAIGSGREGFDSLSLAARAGGGEGANPSASLLRQEQIVDAEEEHRPIGGRFEELTDNPFELVNVPGKERSTFSIDVDTASYAKVRNFLNRHQMPPPQAVRIEELINYFDYEYAGPPEGSEVPFNSHIEVAECPWRPSHRLVRVAVKGREVRRDSRPVSNLVFLLDVSGSMNQPNKLPLLKSGMQLLINELNENDLVSIVVYAGAAGLVLPPTSGDQKETIMQALERLQAGGSTAGAQGIQLAYDTAIANYVEGGANRVILCTDGDFNVGVSDTDSLVRMAEQRAKSGVYLSVLAFGMDNHNDQMLEQISNKGNGNYAFIDTLSEARKVLVQQMSGTLLTIAKDVKLQVEFNPARVLSYRLIGYENRVMANVDFRNDEKDAGEIGAGHMVTALYEIVPVPSNQQVQLSPEAKSEDDVPLRYQSDGRLSDAAGSDEILTLFIRYKQPDGDTASELQFPVSDGGRRFGEASQDYRFAAAVAGFGMLLRHSPHSGDLTWDAVQEIAQSAASPDPYGYRTEFLELVEKAKGGSRE